MMDDRDRRSPRAGCWGLIHRHLDCDPSNPSHERLSVVVLDDLDEAYQVHRVIHGVMDGQHEILQDGVLFEVGHVQIEGS